MAVLGPPAFIERFHLLFLAQLGARLDKQLYALKGGCNLRFFFKSIRYSEDLDFDVRTIARETLRRNVNQVLSSLAFARILRSASLAITTFSQPKQTDVTQRWKVQLRPGGASVDLPTRIEFSRRGVGKGVAFEPVDGAVLATHHLSPILVSHYGLEAAFAQKIGALLGRRETQARDVFDLYLLAERGARGAMVSEAARQQSARAGESVAGLGFEDFTGQVVAYLEPGYQSYYGTPGAWRSLQTGVLRWIEKL